MPLEKKMQRNAMNWRNKVGCICISISLISRITYGYIFLLGWNHTAKLKSRRKNVPNLISAINVTYNFYSFGVLLTSIIWRHALLSVLAISNSIVFFELLSLPVCDLNIFIAVELSRWFGELNTCVICQNIRNIKPIIQRFDFQLDLLS